MSGENAATPYVPPPTLEEGKLGRVRVWAALIRDVGLIVGVPVLITVGISLYELQEKAAEAQLKASEAQIKVIESQVKVVEAQNAALKDTQYDKANALLKSQKELFDRERGELARRSDEEQAAFKARADKLEADDVQFRADYLAHLKELSQHYKALRDDYERMAKEMAAKRSPPPN